ncbi:GFA family protein [Pendulispora albinea]|uniref:GFA family protein n=1 Tax=Pendulispora albinea TaxID=2741071 RepID=A0ABZ2MAP1_9BACT
MGTAKTYCGGCHCGNVRFEVEADLARVVECNCSHCSRKGFLLTFVTSDRFRLLQGEEALVDYQFNRRIGHHLFCKVCGVEAFWRSVQSDGTPMAIVNVRCLDDVPPGSFTVTHVDGKSR